MVSRQHFILGEASRYLELPIVVLGTPLLFEAWIISKLLNLPPTNYIISKLISFSDHNILVALHRQQIYLKQLMIYGGELNLMDY